MKKEIVFAAAIAAASLMSVGSAVRAQGQASSTGKAASDNPFLGTFSSPDDPSTKAWQEISRQQNEMNTQAAALAAAGKTAEAISLYEESIKLDPRVAYVSPVNPYRGIAQIYVSQGRYADAAAEYEKFWQTDGGGRRFVGNQDVKLEYAIVLHQLGQYDEAFAMYKRAMLEDPFLLQGVGYVPFDIRVTDVNYTTRQLPTAAHLALGISYYWSRGPQEAADQFKLAIRLNPNYGPSYFYLAEALRWGQASDVAYHLADREAAYRQADKLGSALVRRRAEQELHLLPPITGSEVETLSKPVNDRIREIEQNRNEQLGRQIL